MTKQEYIAAADETCAELQSRVEEIQESLDLTDAGEVADSFEEVADETEGTLEELRALPKPRGDEARLDRFLDSLEKQLGNVRELAEAIRSEDEEAFRRLQREAGSSVRELGEAATDYGFDDCALQGG